MLYKNHQIVVWKTEWIGRRIHGEYYSLLAFCYLDRREPGQHYEYIAIIDEINPPRSCEIWGGSTPGIVIDLAKFSIDLEIAHCQRWTLEEREERWRAHHLKLRLNKRS